MKAAEVTTDLIGKRCKCIFTGLIVTGSYSGDMHPPKKQICLYFMT